MKRLIAGAVLAAVASVAVGTEPQGVDVGQGAGAGTPPNVVIILADDMGYNDLSCFGSPSIRTPRIDSLAKDGTRFTDFYVGAAVCTPSSSSPSMKAI